jgi:hypothetical protein
MQWQMPNDVDECKYPSSELLPMQITQPASVQMRSSENLRLEVSFQPCSYCITFRLGGCDGLTCACSVCFLCFFCGLRGLPWGFVPLRWIQSVFDSLKRAGYLLLCRCYCSYTANWCRVCSHDQNRHRHRHRRRCCVVRNRTEYMWLERLSDLLCLLTIFYTCNLRPTSFLTTGNPAAVYHVPTSLPQVLPRRLGC